MKGKYRFPALKMIVLLILLFVAILVAVSVGSADLSVKDSLYIMLSKILGFDVSSGKNVISEIYVRIVWDIRMPRILTAALVGGALALVGAVFQGIFQNSLADPYTLGVSSGAALGATIAMLFGSSIQIFAFGTVGLFSFIGAILTVFVVYHVAGISGKATTVNMLLTGTAISTLLSAVISLIMTFHDDEISKVYMWTMGSFASATWEKVCFLVIFVGIGSVIFIILAEKLNLMLMGEEDAKCLGLDTNKLRKLFIVTASLLVAASVSVSGIIGFVGLIIPHCVRMLSGADHRKLLPFAGVTGAIFLVICDTVARTIAAPTEIPVGIITSLFGVPYFIFLLMRQQKQR